LPDVYTTYKTNSGVISKITANKEAMTSIASAIEKQDAKGYRALLKKYNIPIRYCRVICWWVLRRRCYWFCWKLGCLPPQLAPEWNNFDELQKVAEIEAKITADKDLIKSLHDAYQRGNVDKFQEIVKKNNLWPYCFIICRHICYIHRELVCKKICLPIPM